MSESTTPETDPTKDPSSTDPESGRNGSAAARWILLAVVVVVTIAVTVATGVRSGSSNNAPGGAVAATPGQAGIQGQVTTAGRFEVTAKLMELPGAFLPNDGLYNYAFVLKYEVLDVHRGGDDVGKVIHVAHYNPRKTRSEVGDEFYPDLGGTVDRFRAGDVHRLAMEEPWDEHYIGPLVDRYHETTGKRLYWGIWSNSVGEER